MGVPDPCGGLHANRTHGSWKWPCVGGRDATPFLTKVGLLGRRDRMCHVKMEKDKRNRHVCAEERRS